jgi:hypothetical protein
MKKIFIWVFMFALLGAYTFGVVANHDESGLTYAYATNGRDHVRHDMRPFERIIERLTIRKEEAERKCETLPERRAVAHCKRATILGNLIAAFSGHVS